MRSSRYHAIQQQANSNNSAQAENEQHTNAVLKSSADQTPKMKANIGANLISNTPQIADYRTLDANTDFSTRSRQNNLVLKVLSPRSQKRHSNKPDSSQGLQDYNSLQLSVNSGPPGAGSSSITPGIREDQY